jgi:hypothetical protein
MVVGSAGGGAGAGSTPSKPGAWFSYDILIVMSKKILVLALGVVSGACSSSTAKSDGDGAAGAGGADAGPVGTYATGTLEAKGAPKIDVLFVIDDWASTTTQVGKLATQIPTFMQVLKKLPTGLPDVHIAVVTADMGADTGGASSTCSATGDGGAFRSGPVGACTATTLEAGATFIADDASGMTKNFTLPDPEGLSTVLQCILPLGGSGCAFAQPLASAARALGADGQPAPAQNAGFLRDDAVLGIILLTNQDDCSVPPGSGLFSDSSTKVSDPLGPLSEYRCNEFGHLCGGVAPPRTSPDPTDLTTMVTLEDCESNESGMLTPIASFVDGIKSLKSDPTMILAAAITAPSMPYTVTWNAPPQGADTQPWPVIEASCTSSNGDGTFGDPSVRTAQWIMAFGDNGVLTSICDASYASSIAAIASKLGAMVGPKCITDVIRQDGNGVPECTLTAHATNDGGVTDRAVPSCDASGGAAPCWTLTSGSMTCTNGGLAFTVSADPADPNPTALTFSYRCAVCTAGATTPGCP